MGYSIYVACQDFLTTEDGERLPPDVIDHFVSEERIYLRMATSEMKNNTPLDYFYYSDDKEDLQKLRQLIEKKFGIKCKIHENLHLICGDVEF